MALSPLFLVLLAQAAVAQCSDKANACEGKLEDTVSLVQLSKIAVKRTKDDSKGQAHGQSDDSVLSELFAAARHKGEKKSQGPDVNVNVDIEFANNSANPPPMPCDQTPPPAAAYGAPVVPVVRDSIWGGADNITIVVNPAPPATTTYNYPIAPMTMAPLTGMPVSAANALINPNAPGVPLGYNQQVVPGPGMPQAGMGVPGYVPAAISTVGIPVDPMHPGVPASITPMALLEKDTQTATEIAEQKAAEATQATPAIQQTAPQAAMQAASASTQTGMFTSFAQIIQAGVEKIAEEAAVNGMETGVGRGISRGLQKTGFGGAGATALQTGAAAVSPAALAPAAQNNLQPVPAFAPTAQDGRNNITIYVSPSNLPAVQQSLAR